MRARAVDPPRTMSQKILAHHEVEDGSRRDLMEVRVDQLALARQPSRVLGTAVDEGLASTFVEVSVAYHPHCIPVQIGPEEGPQFIPPEALHLGFLVAQPGAGFAASIHLERFGSPGRLLLSDEPRFCQVGGAASLALPASRSQLSEAARTGKTSLRPPRSIQIILSGRLRPFVCVRDATLHLIREGLSGVVEAVDRKYSAPVVLEFSGPSVKLLSVADRAVLAGIAWRVGAAASLFPSDEKTESFLRDQKRSKAYRSLAPDAGAPYDDVVGLDLASVEPLFMDRSGRVDFVRSCEGGKVSQVLLGGDSGLTLRDFLAVAALLKSKRVAPGVDFLLCPPSRQVLEVLARTEALVDLIATGARLVEPDRRVLSGELYPNFGPGLSLRTADHEGDSSGLVVSPETCAYSLFHGSLGDPRGFKRPVRISIPRQYSTDDVLLLRAGEGRGGAKGKGRATVPEHDPQDAPPSSGAFAESEAHRPWNGSVKLSISRTRAPLAEPSAWVAKDLDDVRWLAENATNQPDLRVLLASHIPSGTVSVLSALGILALRVDEATLESLAEGSALELPPDVAQGRSHLRLRLEGRALEAEWLAIGEERDWAARGGRSKVPGSA